MMYSDLHAQLESIWN